MPSAALCSTIMATPRAAMARVGRWMSAARMIMLTPMTQMTWATPRNLVSHPESDPDVTSVNSRTMSQRPRVHEEAGELGYRLAAGALQVCAGTGEEDEDWGAEVRDPAGEEDGGRRDREVGRVEVQSAAEDEVARVVQDHDDHHDPAEEVDPIEPRAPRRVGSLPARVRGRSPGVGRGVVIEAVHSSSPVSPQMTSM